MIRRLKKDVLPELPDKLYSFVPIELDNDKEYSLAENDFISYVHSTKGEDAAVKASMAVAFAKAEGLKQLCVRGKLKQATEWIQDFLDIDGKLVVYAHHKFVIDALMQQFEKIALKIDGSVASEQRQGLVDRFQTDESIRLFVISSAGGVGITLTAASNIAILELPWTPGAMDQAIDRLHRIGQKDTVNVHYLLAAGTIEERIANLLDAKRSIIRSVLDGEDAETESLLSELMNLY
jgi:SWI/SNF-related matrix-associated actin-dependent regulator 1 of chromatin subfamily A